MKKANKRLDMTFHPREELANQPVTDIMDVQNNSDRGDGAPAPKVMTTFQMDAKLKETLKTYCRENGLKLGDCINRAVKQFLEEENI